MSDQSRLDLCEDLAVRPPSGGLTRRPGLPAADIASELARLGPHLTSLADELRECLTERADESSPEQQTG